jgi:alkanesulfonate monooxygenase
LPPRLEIISSITQLAPSKPDDGPERLIAAAQQAEQDGVDALLIGYTATRPDGWILASYALAHTERIRILLAHRPGVISPTAAARMTGTLAVLSRGRISLNVVAGGSMADQLREGDATEHDDRYLRSTEYVEILRRLWTSDSPFDHEGRFYRLVKAYNTLKPYGEPGTLIYMGGASDAAKQFAVAEADVYMAWSEPVPMVKQRVDELKALAKASGRRPLRYSVSMRLIMRDTEDEAWAAANALLPEDIEQRRNRAAHHEDIGRNRQLDLVRDSLVHDERLWMGLAAATGGQGSTGALVGTASQVMDSLLRYVDEAGVDTVLLTGQDGAYDPLPAGFLPELRRRANEILELRRSRTLTSTSDPSS